MMDIDAEKATRIIESLASNDHQVQHDRSTTQRTGVLELNTADAILAQNKILSQQMEALVNQLSKFPKQMHLIHHQNYPSISERMSKLENTVEKFVQASLINQRNTDTSIQTLESQVDQLDKQLAEFQKRESQLK